MTPLQNLRRNFAKMILGTSTASAFNLAALIINTNALGVLLFGYLVIIQSVTELFSGIFSFKTWQSINKFGARDLIEDNYSRLLKRYYFALTLDLAAAMVATLSAITVFLFFLDEFGVETSVAPLGMVYAISAGFQFRSASVGVLRLTERFGRAIAVQTIEAAVLLLNAALLWWVDAPFAWYIYSIAAIHVFAAITVSALAYFHVKQMERDVGVRDDHSFDRRKFVWFALAISASGTLSTMRRRGEVLIVSAILGPAAAGLFGVAFRGAYLIARIAEAGRISVYPVLAKLVSDGSVQEAKGLVLKTTLPVVLVASSIFIATIFFGDYALAAVFGDEFVAAYPSLIWLMIGTLAYSSLFAALPLIEIYHGAKRALILTSIAFVVFLVAAFIGPSVMGVAGAGLGGAAFGITLFVLVMLHVMKAKSDNKAHSEPFSG